MHLATVVTILLLHGGGFVGGTTQEVKPFADDLRDAGYHVVVVDYLADNPNGNVLGEIGTVKRAADAARADGPVVAYGLSAGATLAADLAARGEVDGAVVAGGPTDLLTWFCLSPLTSAGYWAGLGMTPTDRRAASPQFLLDGHPSPQLLMYGDIDPLVQINQGLDYYDAARKQQPDTQFVLMPVAPHTFRQPYPTEAKQWIEARWPAGDLRPTTLKDRIRIPRVSGAAHPAARHAKRSAKAKKRATRRR
ncbi:MAG TPA: alpha/beta hydrolase [Solirubrobacteraceae bacterium]|jgi:acetyl esterase/lipase